MAGLGRRSSRGSGRGARSYVVATLVAAAVIGVGAGIVETRRHASSPPSDQLRFRGADVRPPEGVRVTVELFNASQHRGLGRRAMFYLRDRGFDVVTLGTAPVAGDTTVVIARRSHAEWANLVAHALGSARAVVRPDSSRDVDVSVYLGASWRPPSQPLYP
jgi:hypothetical protein